MTTLFHLAYVVVTFIFVDDNVVPSGVQLFMVLLLLFLPKTTMFLLVWLRLYFVPLTRKRFVW